jgi:hypothetical protein
VQLEIKMGSGVSVVCRGGAVRVAGRDGCKSKKKQVKKKTKINQSFKIQTNKIK